MINLKCPSCKNIQKYNPLKNSGNFRSKKKKCVFCGHNFSVYKNKNIKGQIFKMEDFVTLKS